MKILNKELELIIYAIDHCHSILHSQNVLLKLNHITFGRQEILNRINELNKLRSKLKGKK